MTIIGLKELNKKLTRTVPEKMYLAVQEAMEKSADEAVYKMKRLAPVEFGDLQMSISWTWGEAPKGAIVLARSKRKSKQGLRITIYAGGPEAYYARWIEFGRAPFIAGGKFAGAQVPRTPAQPFFFPGWRLARRSVKGRVTRAIRKAAREVAAK